MRRAAGPALVAALGALVYIVLAPDSADLAAASFRSGLFEREGFTLFSTAWYGGHHTPGYSVLAPILGAWLGERVLAGLSVVAGTIAFTALAGRTSGLLIVPALLASAVSGRIAFTLGAALGLAAVCSCVRGSRWPAAAFALLTALASPVAALFLALAATALTLRDSPFMFGGGRGQAFPAAAGRWGDSPFMFAAAVVPTAFLVLAFPEGGTFPFVASAFWPAFAAAVAVVVVAPAGALRIGAGLYALLLAGTFLVDSPVGGNAVRLGTLAVVPVAFALLWPHRRVALVALALPLAYWVLQPAVRDVRRTQGDPSVEASYHRPLVGFLAERAPVRVEIPLSQNHGEAEHVAPHVAIARGWERQLDLERNGLFYAPGPLSPARYERWLKDNAVAYVALPEGLPLDRSGEEEKTLVARGPRFLRPVARRGRWRIFAVRGARPLASRAARMTRLGADSFALRFARPGHTVVRVRYTPYWSLTDGFGCVGPAPGGWTLVVSRRPGRVVVRTRFGLGRVRARDRRCR